jgi:hypothetical protein
MKLKSKPMAGENALPTLPCPGVSFAFKWPKPQCGRKKTHKSFSFDVIKIV